MIIACVIIFIVLLVGFADIFLLDEWKYNRRNKSKKKMHKELVCEAKVLISSVFRN